MKSIKSVSANGKVRSFETVAIFALNNAFAEGLPFTALDAFGIKGKTITHNFNK